MSVTAMKPIGVYVQLTREEMVLALDALDAMPLNPLTFYTRQSLNGKLYTAAYGSKGKQRLLESIGSTVCEAFHMPLGELLSPGRAQHINLTRQIAFYLCRIMTKRSFPEIGRYFNRDHSTVIHGCNLITARMARDTAFRSMIHRLQTTIGDRQHEESSRQGTRAEEMGQDNQGGAISTLAKDDCGEAS